MKLLLSAKIFLLGWLSFAILAALYKTVRWVRNDLETQPEGESPRIFAIWHGRVLMSPFIYRDFTKRHSKRVCCVLVSRHFDGQLIGAALRHAGLRTVSGSSTRGGSIGMLGLVRAIREGNDAAIMPDGPRGPCYEVKAGTIKIAHETGALIYPTSFGFERSWKFASWDGMLLPKPFTRGVVVIGKPQNIPKEMSNDDLDAAKSALKTQMMRTLEEADSYVYA